MDITSVGLIPSAAHEVTGFSGTVPDPVASLDAAAARLFGRPLTCERNLANILPALHPVGGRASVQSRMAVLNRERSRCELDAFHLQK